MKRNLSPEGSTSPAKKNCTSVISSATGQALPTVIIDEEVEQSLHSEDEESEGGDNSSESDQCEGESITSEDLHNNSEESEDESGEESSQADNNDENEENVVVAVEENEPLPAFELPSESRNLTARELMSWAILLLRHLKRDLLRLGLSINTWERHGLEALLEVPEKIPGATIAVVGRQGVGKSSLVNAILDEDSLPTGSMSWCTGVPTKIKYHANTTYRAKIKTIRPREWVKVVEDAKNFLSSKAGKERCESTGDNICGSGLQMELEKVRAVYPCILILEVDILLPDSYVQSVFKMPRCMEFTTIQEFSGRVSNYIENKAYGALSRPPALWPLIEKITIYTKSEALASGTTILDLPGVKNVAAASEQAAKFLPLCQSIWIVTDTSWWGGDDIAATFEAEFAKTQLQLESKHKTATRICTKTDIIDLLDIAKRMRLQESNHEYFHIMRDINKLKQSISLSGWSQYRKTLEPNGDR